jgi:AraC-like DNA-binding protein
MIRLFERVSAEEILNLSLDELAGRFSCSRRHLNRLFHQHFGLSVAALRMEMRLLKAVSLLRNPGPKLITLAKECGFNHLGLFNACFKRRFGLSPGQWRKNLETDRKPTPMLAAADPNCRLRVSGLCPLLGSAEVRYPGASHPSSVIRGP